MSESLISGRTPIDSNQNMYNRKPMAKNKQAMDDDAVDPNMSFKNIMKDVQHFGKNTLSLV